MRITRYSGTAGNTVLNTIETTPLTAGVAVPISVAVTPTGLTFTRTDTGDSVSATDDTYRGLRVGWFSSGPPEVQISDLVVT